MITTASKEVYQTLLDLRSHGMIRGLRRWLFKAPWEYEMQALGFNYRMTDFQSALGIEQLKKLPLFLKKRRQIAEAYVEAFSQSSEIKLPPVDHLGESSWHLFVIQILGQQDSEKREFLYTELAKKRIFTQVHYMPVYRQPYYRKLGYRGSLCPEAEKAYRGILSLPIYPSLTVTQARLIADQVKKILKNYRKKS